MAGRRVIGIDFDNTIICYDNVFGKLAGEMDLKVGELSLSKKNEIRDYLRSVDREDEWTEMQGHAYGNYIGEGRPFPGVEAFFAFFRDKNVTLHIVSHKTRHPYLGPKYDLHEAAMGWLAANGFLDTAGFGIPVGNVHLELTKQDKIGRIASLGCAYFIDDLPEFLNEPAFPAAVRKLLFDPEGAHLKRELPFPRFANWDEILACLQNDPD